MDTLRVTTSASITGQAAGDLAETVVTRAVESAASSSIVLDDDEEHEVSFGGADVVTAVVLRVEGPGSIRAILSTGEGADEVLPVDPVLCLTADRTPITRLRVQRVGSVDVTVRVMLATAAGAATAETDTEMLQAWLARGGLVVLPNRTLTVDERLDVLSNTHLRGGGPDCVLTQDPAADLFVTLVNADRVDGNENIVIEDLVLDGARLNAQTPTPWTASRPYAEGDCVFDSTTDGKIYRCAVGGVSGGSVPTGTGAAIVDGGVTWAYVCPLWAQTDGVPLEQSSLAYFTRCRSVHFRRVTFRRSRANGLIIEGSADADFVFGPRVVPIGAFGVTAYTYWIVAKDGSGNPIAISSGTRITDGPNALNGSTFNRIEWPAILGASTYDVLKGNTQTKVASTAALYFDDTGGATSAYTPPGPALVATRAGNLSATITLEDCVFEDCNKAALYCSSAERVAGSGLHFDRNFEGLVPACTWWSSFTGVITKRSVEGNGLAPGRDTQFCYFEGAFDGVNTIVGEISSAPVELHGKLYPTIFSLTSVTPAVPGATPYTYWVIAKDVRGRPLAISTTATGHITNGAVSPDNTLSWAAFPNAVSYDILKLVGGSPALIVNQPGTSYHDTGAATSAYDISEIAFHYGFSNCEIRGTVDYGSVALRKSFRNKIDLLLRRPGTAPDVSTPHAVDLQGSSDNDVRVHVTDAGDDGSNFGTHHAVGVEDYTDPTFGITLYSHRNEIRCRAIDTRATQIMDAVFVKPSNLHNRVLDCFTNINDGTPYRFQEPTTVARGNAAVQANGSVLVDAPAWYDNGITVRYRMVPAGVPTYADNTAAVAGGLVAGDLYKTAAGALMVCLG